MLNLDTDKLHEECGVFGIFLSEKRSDIVNKIYYALYSLQHRGQESCGIALRDGAEMRVYARNGLVGEVFGDDELKRLGDGECAIGHVRYGITAQSDSSNAQPMLFTHAKGKLAIANNGSLTNYKQLRRYLELEGMVLHSDSDAELILNFLIREWLVSNSPEEALRKVMYRLDGAYTLLIMTKDSLIAARDPHGFRPMCIGSINGGYVFASESCALDSIGATFVRDIMPGEIVIADNNGLRTISDHKDTHSNALCVFEFVYFSRPDSVIGGVSVHAARREAGKFLAKDHGVKADIVVGVPDSGIDAAIGYSLESGVPYGLGFIKNKYIGRTFIQPTQENREDLVRIKLNPIAEVVAGKRVVLVDDSIVRGTTCERIIKLMRSCGAAEVHMRVSSPMFLHPCYFGTDVASKKNLIANEHSVDEIRDIINADSLGFLSVDRVSQIAGGYHGGFCIGCFTGEYPCQVS